MSGELPDELAEDDVEDATGDGGDRRHALWGLTVLVLVAVLVVTLAVVLSGNGDSPDGDHIHLGVPTDVATPTSPGNATTTPAKTGSGTSSRSGSASTTHSTTHSATPAPSSTTAAHTTSARSTPPPTTTHPRPPRNPCRSTDPCVIDGDAGVPGAFNDARRRRGLPAVNVRVTTGAQQCAAGGTDCGGQHAVQNESTLNGQQAVTDLLSTRGSDWLLSPSTNSLALGWAYDPSIHQYLCVLALGG